MMKLHVSSGDLWRSRTLVESESFSAGGRGRLSLVGPVQAARMLGCELWHAVKRVLVD